MIDSKKDKDSGGGEFVMALDGSSTKARNLAILKRIPDALKLFKEACREFQVIKKSIYIDRKQKTPTEEDIYICECINSSDETLERLADPCFSFDCKEKCINRSISTECEAKSCPCGELCNNRQFQLQQDRCVYPFKAGGKGWGLKAGEFIPAGSFIIQYLGEIFSIKSEEGIKRLSKFAKATCTYLMRISAKEVIDPSSKGNIARFINHSCDPNCITQKWNVLGEVAVGIFAIKDIQPDEELTFDYKFDVYKTPFLACLCGAKNCKGFLGLLETLPELPVEELETRQDSGCEVCQKLITTNEDLLACDGCGREYHLECLHIAEVPRGSWYCAVCQKEKSSKPATHLTAESINLDHSESYLLANKETLRSRRKIHFKEVTDSVFINFNKEFEKMEIPTLMKKQSYIDELNKQDELHTVKYLLSPAELAVFKRFIPRLTSVTKMSIFWNISDSRHRNFFIKAIELTVIGTRIQTDLVNKVIKLIESSARRQKDNAGFTENSFKMPAIFLKRMLNEFSQGSKNLEKELNIKISFNKNHISDECYPIHFLTVVTLKGKPDNVKKAHQMIKDKMGQLIVKRKYLNRADIKIIMNKLQIIKRDIGVAEIRCCRDNALRDINHPFYTIYYKDKEFAIIGTSEEVTRADKIISKQIEISRQKEDNVISLNYLIPVCNKSQLINIKTRIEKKFPGAKMIIYDPLHPRKNVSLTLSTTYRGFDSFFNEVRNTLDNQKLYQGYFDVYQKQMLYQMSKYFFKYLQNFKQTNSMVFMKSWDTITAEFDENSPYFNSAYGILKDKLSKDYEFKFYIIRVNSLYKAERMAKLGLSKHDYLAVLRKTLIRKNEHMISKDSSIFGDVETGRIPDDYLLLISKTNGSLSDEESRYPRNKSGMKALEYSPSSESNRIRGERPAHPPRLVKRPKQVSFSSSPEYNHRHRKSPEPPRYNLPVPRRPPPVHKPVSKSISSNSSLSKKNQERKVQNDSFSSRDISIHYRDAGRHRPSPRYFEREYPPRFPAPKPIKRRSPSSRSSSVPLSSSSISDSSHKKIHYSRYHNHQRKHIDIPARDYDRRNYESGGVQRFPLPERYDSYSKTGLKRNK